MYICLFLPRTHEVVVVAGKTQNTEGFFPRKIISLSICATAAASAKRQHRHPVEQIVPEEEVPRLQQFCADLSQHAREEKSTTTFFTVFVHQDAEIFLPLSPLVSFLLLLLAVLPDQVLNLLLLRARASLVMFTARTRAND